MPRSRPCEKKPDAYRYRAAFFGGRPEELLRKVLMHEVIAVATREIADEYQKTISYLAAKCKGKRSHLSAVPIISALELISNKSKVEVCRDPDDNKFISCALDGRCCMIHALLRQPLCQLLNSPNEQHGALQQMPSVSERPHLSRIQDFCEKKIPKKTRTLPLLVQRFLSPNADFFWSGPFINRLFVAISFGDLWNCAGSERRQLGQPSVFPDKICNRGGGCAAKFSFFSVSPMVASTCKQYNDCEVPHHALDSVISPSLYFFLPNSRSNASLFRKF